jgi:hypothetical protein
VQPLSHPPYTAVAGGEDLPTQPPDAFRAQHPLRSPQESAQDPHPIQEKSAVGGMVDVGLHHRRVNPQLASTGDSQRWSEFDGLVVEGGHRLGADHIGPADEGGVVRSALQIEAAKLPQDD